MNKLSIYLGAEVNYSSRDKNTQTTLTKDEIDKRIQSFAHLNQETGNPISDGKCVSNMIGKPFFTWLNQETGKPFFAWLKETTNDPEEKIRIEYTKRVIGLIKDLQSVGGLKNAKISFSGENVKYLVIQMLAMALNSFKFTNKVKGPLGGCFNANYLQALNANQPLQLTQSDIDKKGDKNEWKQVEANYIYFIEKLQLTSPSHFEYRIPKKVHLVWIGPNPASQDVLDVKKSWEDHHLGWEVKLWGNNESEKIVQEVAQEFPIVKEVWAKAVRWAEKADIVRYCVLYKEGGVYADTDLPCYGKVDEFHSSDFYAGLEQNDHGNAILYVGNALIGAKAKHPIIIGCLEDLKPRKEGEDNWAIIGRTGPGLLTDQVYKSLRKDSEQGTKETLVLPPAYFYPLHSTSKDKAKDPAFIKECVLKWSKGLHLWNLSWTK